ncbi:hypothetical protein JHH79_001992 [Salmonella enterica]|nr:hypothetical protein [Salmonella enterica]EEN1732298.1 hypothetical protein [Salmonella enterica subsp. enterica]EEQ0495770.1 hypothetical protein [Salmonella enterica subsp. enterica serovar Havana]EEY1224166.1 hypothetical protein [Salmonella enterica]EFP4951779.1 hypothetical protein [Salmonella enterica]
MFPAPAGINRWTVGSWAIIRCVPRASGDKPQVYFPRGQALECSPRQRG